MDVSSEIAPLCQAFVHGLQAALGQNLFAVYLYGAVTFPQPGPLADLDLHVVIRERPDGQARAAIQDLHAALARDYPPLGAELDVHYILLADARRSSPPPHQVLPGVVDLSWALHRAHWRAGRCFVLFGPDPRRVVPEPSWPELEAALEGELDYVRAHLADAPAYCVLNLCRLILSFQTRDVVCSKRASAARAAAAFPAWQPLIDAALRSYDGRAAPDDDERLCSELHSFLEFACRARGKAESGA